MFQTRRQENTVARLQVHRRIAHATAKVSNVRLTFGRVVVRARQTALRGQLIRVVHVFQNKQRRIDVMIGHMSGAASIRLFVSLLLCAGIRDVRVPQTIDRNRIVHMIRRDAFDEIGIQRRGFFGIHLIGIVSGKEPSTFWSGFHRRTFRCDRREPIGVEQRPDSPSRSSGEKYMFGAFEFGESSTYVLNDRDEIQMSREVKIPCRRRRFRLLSTMCIGRTVRYVNDVSLIKIWIVGFVRRQNIGTSRVIGRGVLFAASQIPLTSLRTCLLIMTRSTTL